MRSRFLSGLMLFGLCGLCACQSLKKSETPGPPTTSQASSKPVDLAKRNNALALLDDLLNDEKNLSKVLIIKRSSDELKNFVETISKSCRERARMLESFAKEPAVDLKQMGLPPGETATREAIAKTKEHLLLHSKDAEFELQLLLTQVDALNYGAHLARVVAENEPDPGRSRAYSDLSSQLTALHEQAVAMLRRKRSGG